MDAPCRMQDARLVRTTTWYDNDHTAHDTAEHCLYPCNANVGCRGPVKQRMPSLVAFDYSAAHVVYKQHIKIGSCVLQHALQGLLYMS